VLRVAGDNCNFYREIYTITQEIDDGRKLSKLF
jgi:hypothetical protein